MDTIIAMLRRCQLFSVILVATATTMLATPASAAFHLWQIKEAFSNSDGSVQFIEMFNSNANEGYISNFTLQAESIVGGNTVEQTFTFPSDLFGVTMDRHLLIATTGFGSLPGGVTPDFTFAQSLSLIVGPFFNPNATSVKITFSGSSDVLEFTGAQLPKNGINSLTDAGAVGIPPGTPNISSGVNSPTNLANQTGSINLSTGPTGDYNGNHVVDAADYIIWRDRLNQSVPAGSGPDGSNNGFIDLADYTFWRSKFGNSAPGAASGVPEPAIALGMAFIAFIAAASRRRR
jgi:hypothetical protein